MQIVSREQAVASGLKRYFSGVACQSGHIVERRTSDGQCIACRSERQAEHRRKNPEKWRAYYRGDYARHAEKNRAYAKSYRITNKERVRLGWQKWQNRNRAYNIQRHKEWVARNKGKIAAWRSRYRQQNRDKLNALLRRWLATHPLEARSYRANRRAAALAGGKHTAHELRDILLLQKWKCALCRVSLKRKKRHLDHIKALSKGGSNARKNLQFLCESCNTSKRDKDQIDFMRARGMLL